MLTNPVDTSVTNNGELANNAQQTADNAKDLAETADSNIKNINDPNYLSPFEKPQLKIQMDNFATIYVADKDIATAEGIDFTAYDAAYQAYLAYMTPLIADMTTYSPIVRSTFNSMVTAVQAEQKRFNAATQAQYNQQIKKAQTDIDDGQTKYKALQSEAKIMESSVAGISDTADRAISSAGFASNAASTASQAASSALANAMSAENAASSAVAKANSTASEFGKVSQKTDSAFSNAMSAESAASSAVSQALSAASDSKDAKQIAGAVSQSYKTLTDGSTMTIAELQNGLAAKLTKTDLNGYATQDWSQNQIKLTADGINGTMSSIKSTVDSQTTSINDLQADSRGFKDQFTTVTNTLGTQTTDISTLQASSKELTSGFNTLTTDNTTNKNDISQLKQTATEVSSTLETVQTQVQNSAVGTNLLLKTYESFGMTGNNTVNQTQPMYALSRRLEAGTTVTLSFDAVSTAPASFGILSNGLDGGAWTTYISDTVDTTARHYVGTIAPTNFSDLGITMRLDNVPSTTTITVSNVKLEIGYNATDYSTNPLDNATVTAMSKLSQTVDGMKTDISKKIEQKDLNGYATEDWAQNQIKLTADGLNGTISSVKSTVDGHTTSINDLKADSSGFKAQFQTVNDTIGKHTTDIGTLQSDARSLSSNFDSLNTDNNTNKNDISELKQTAKDFSSTISKVNSLGQVNLVYNSGYKNNMDGWNLLEDGYTSTVPASMYQGSIGLGTNYTGKSATKWTEFAESKHMPLPSTQIDTFSNVMSYGAQVKIYEETDKAAGVQVCLSFYNASGTRVTGYSGSTLWVNAVNYGQWYLASGVNVPVPADAVTFGIQYWGYGTTVHVMLAHPMIVNAATLGAYVESTIDLATVAALTQVKQTADSAQVLATNNQGDIAKLQVTAHGIQTTVGNNYNDLSSQVSQTNSAWQVALSNSGQTNLVYNSEFANKAEGWTVTSQGYLANDPASTYQGSPGWALNQTTIGWIEFGQTKLYKLPDTIVRDDNTYSASAMVKLYGETTDGNVLGATLAYFDSNQNRVTGWHDMMVESKASTRNVWTLVKFDDYKVPANAIYVGLQFWAHNGTGAVKGVISHPMITSGPTVGTYNSDSASQADITALADDINLRVKKGDVVNQFNIDAGGALLSTSGNSTKIVFSSPNIIFDTVNPVQIPNVNIPGTLTGKTIDASEITGTTKIKGSDIESPLIHSPSGSFKLDGNTGDIIGASIHSADNSWGIDKYGNINGATINAPTLNLGLNGTFTESYDYTQQASMFLPKNSNGTLTFNHGVLQSTGHMQTYNGSQWGGMNDSLVFQSGIDNAQWTEVAPGYLKMDLYTQGSNPNVLQRAYADPTGYYYTDITGHYTYLGNILNTQQVQAPSIFTTALNLTPKQLRMQIVSNGSDWGLQVGSYSGSEAVLSDFIYNSTSSSSANLYITANGHIVRSTSASKYKYNIKHAINEDSLADKLLTMHVSTWNDKHAVDSYAQTLTDNTESEDISIKDNYGLIAEDLRDAGLDMFIEYGKNHTIEGIKYDRAWLPLLPKIRQMNDKINEYELRISKLEAKINE